MIFTVTLVGCLLMQMDDAEGADQSVFQGPGTQYPYANYQYASYNYIHTKDDLLVIAHTNTDGDLICSYKELITDSWNTTEIAAYNWDGFTGPWKVYGLVNTQNGSIAICAGNYDGATYLDSVYLWIHFIDDPWSTWDDEELIDGTTHYKGTVAINDTDHIMFAGQRGQSTPYYIYYQIFDFENYEIKNFASWFGVNWASAGGMNGFIALSVNSSGNFHFVFRENDGDHSYASWEWSWAERVEIEGSSSYLIRDAGFLQNDMMFCAGLLSNDGVYLWRQSDYEGAFTRVLVSTDANDYSYGVALVLHSGDNHTSLIAFRATEDHLYKWNAAWDGSSASWQNSEIELDVYDSSYIRTTGSSKCRFPQDGGGRQWTLPREGWGIVGWNDTGSSDTHELILDGATFWGDLTTDDPEITTASLPDATYDVFYLQTLSYTGGTAPLTWTILIGPAWLSIGSSNGTLYGTPDATGSETVRVRLTDDIPRTDEEEWTLTINPASSGSPGDTGEATSFVIDEMGELWVLLALTAVFVGIARSYKMVVWRKNTR